MPLSELARSHPVWVCPDERMANLSEMDLPVSEEELPVGLVAACS